MENSGISECEKEIIQEKTIKIFFLRKSPYCKPTLVNKSRRLKALREPYLRNSAN